MRRVAIAALILTAVLGTLSAAVRASVVVAIYAITVVLIIALGLAAIVPVTTADIGAFTFWSGFSDSALAAEIWIRQRRPAAGLVH